VGARKVAAARNGRGNGKDLLFSCYKMNRGRFKCKLFFSKSLVQGLTADADKSDSRPLVTPDFTMAASIRHCSSSFMVGNRPPGVSTLQSPYRHP